MGIARKELTAAALLACRQCLEEIGFIRHTWDIFTLPLAPKILGWVGLGRATHRGDGSMRIEPTVGLLQQDIERMISKVAHLPYHRYYPATVQTIVGRLTPKATYLRIDFHSDELATEPAGRLCEAITNYGVPWMREHASLAAIYSLVTSDQYTVPLHTFKAPVIAWMLGRPDLAHQHLQSRLAQMAEDKGPNAVSALELYKRFVAALEERMSHTSVLPSPRDEE